MRFNFLQYILFAALFISTSSYALDSTSETKRAYFVDAALGLAQTSYGTTHHPVIVDVPENYVDNTAAKTTLMYGLFGGIRLPLRSNFSVETGLSLYQLSNVSITGSGSQQQLANFSYQYSVASLAAFWESRFFYTIPNHVKFSPFAIAAIGMANNNFHAYQNTYDSQTVPPPGFSDHAQTSFAYALGLGLQYAINVHWSAAVSYRYQNLGSAVSGSLAIPSTPSLTSTLKSNVALLEVQYLI